MAERVQVRPISNEEGNRLLRILRRGTGSVVMWRRAQMVLLSAQAMDVPQIARVTFTSEDRVRDVIHNFQRRRVRVAVPALSGWAAAEVHRGAARADQADRALQARGSRSAVLEVELVQVG